MGGLHDELVDGRRVWLLHVVCKGRRERDVVIHDDVKALIDQHQADMARTGIGSDLRVPVRTLLPPAMDTLVATPGAASPGPSSASGLAAIRRQQDRSRRSSASCAGQLSAGGSTPAGSQRWTSPRSSATGTVHSTLPRCCRRSSGCCDAPLTGRPWPIHRSMAPPCAGRLRTV